MAKRRNVVAEELRILAQDLKELLAALTTDPKQQAQKQRLWGVLYALSGAIFTLAARRVAARAWAILTGEQPPTARGPSGDPAPSSVSTASSGPTTPEAASAERGEGEPSDPEAARAPTSTASRDL